MPLIVGLIVWIFLIYMVMKHLKSRTNVESPNSYETDDYSYDEVMMRTTSAHRSVLDGKQGHAKHSARKHNSDYDSYSEFKKDK